MASENKSFGDFVTREEFAKLEANMEILLADKANKTKKNVKVKAAVTSLPPASAFVEALGLNSYMKAAKTTQATWFKESIIGQPKYKEFIIGMIKKEVPEYEKELANSDEYKKAKESEKPKKEANCIWTYISKKENVDFTSVKQVKADYEKCKKSIEEASGAAPNDDNAAEIDDNTSAPTAPTKKSIAAKKTTKVGAKAATAKEEVDEIKDEEDDAELEEVPTKKTTVRKVKTSTAGTKAAKK